MTSCWACDAELAPEWKFCVRCGVPVEGNEPVSRSRTRTGGYTPLALFGIVLSCVVGALLVVAAVVILVSRS